MTNGFPQVRRLLKNVKGQRIKINLESLLGFNFLPLPLSFPTKQINIGKAKEVMARRIPDFPDSFHSWNFLSSIGSGITFLSFAMFSY